MRINTRMSHEVASETTAGTRKMACCPDTYSKEGDSILVVRLNNVNISFHRECIAHAVELMPMSQSAENIQREFVALQEAMRSEGKMFPEVHDGVGRQRK